MTFPRDCGIKGGDGVLLLKQVKIQYQLTLDDLRRTNAERLRFREQLFRSPWTARIYYWVLLPALGVITALICWSYLTGLLVVALYWAGGRIIRVWSDTQYWRRIFTEENYAPYLQPAELELLPDGLVWNSAGMGQLYPWRLVRRMVETPRYFYLRITPVQEFLVPKSAFADDAAREAFRAEVRSHLPSAVPAGAAQTAPSAPA